MPSAHRQDGRRFVQPHDLRPLRFRVLLALHERDQRSALPQPIWLYLLGQETLVSQEENPLAVGHFSRCSSRNRPFGWYRRARNDHWNTHLGRSQALRSFQDNLQAQAQHHHHQWRCCIGKKV